MDGTLTERVARLEKFLECETGFGLAPEYSRCDETVSGGMLGGDYSAARKMQFPQGENQEQSGFEAIIDRIQSCTDRVCRSAGRIEEIGNRIMGSLPKQATGEIGADERSPDGTLEHAHMALNWLDHALSRLEAATLRIERV